MELKNKRFTKREDGYIARECHYPANQVGDAPCYGCADRTKCNANMLEQLAQYEDLGMTPDELKELINKANTMTKELDFINSENDDPNGLVVILPARVGDRVYIKPFDVHAEIVSGYIKLVGHQKRIMFETKCIHADDHKYCREFCNKSNKCYMCFPASDFGNDLIIEEKPIKNPKEDSNVKSI